MHILTIISITGIANFTSQANDAHGLHKLNAYVLYWLSAILEAHFQ